MIESVDAIWRADDAALIGDYLSRLETASPGNLRGERSIVFSAYVRSLFNLPVPGLLFGAGVNEYWLFFCYRADAFNSTGYFLAPEGPHNAAIESLISSGWIDFLIVVSLPFAGWFSPISCRRYTSGAESIAPHGRVGRFRCLVTVFAATLSYFAVVLMSSDMRVQVAGAHD